MSVQFQNTERVEIGASVIAIVHPTSPGTHLAELGSGLGPSGARMALCGITLQPWQYPSDPNDARVSCATCRLLQGAAPIIRASSSG